MAFGPLRVFSPVFGRLPPFQLALYCSYLGEPWKQEPNIRSLSCLSFPFLCSHELISDNPRSLRHRPQVTLKSAPTTHTHPGGERIHRTGSLLSLPLAAESLLWELTCRPRAIRTQISRCAEKATPADKTTIKSLSRRIKLKLNRSCYTPAFCMGGSER